MSEEENQAGTKGTDGQAATANNIHSPCKAPQGFILYEQLRSCVPFCDRTLRDAIRKGLIPSVVLPGGRRRLFHWPSVEAALLRMQRSV
jgi:hypothetical protein